MDKETLEKRNEKIKEIVYEYIKMTDIQDKETVDEMIELLKGLKTNDAIDRILVSLESLLKRGVLTEEQILSKSDLILQLNPEKYHSAQDLISRLQWIKGMNLEHPKMPIEENHELVLETFDKFNKLIGTDFDAFYTGGMMGYLLTEQKLERYHGDLDLFVNEEQLLEFYERIKGSDEFEFLSNINQKEETGHEFIIMYKGTPMSIGLFLFNRMKNGNIVTKEYYYPEKNREYGLALNETHLNKEFASMIFSQTVKEHNGIPFKSQSLEGIYHAKRNSRFKDRFDAQKIERYVDMKIVDRLDNEKLNNYRVDHQFVEGENVVEELDTIIKRDERIKEKKSQDDISI